MVIVLFVLVILKLVNFTGIGVFTTVRPFLVDSNMLIILLHLLAAKKIY